MILPIEVGDKEIIFPRVTGDEEEKVLNSSVREKEIPDCYSST